MAVAANRQQTVGLSHHHAILIEWINLEPGC